MKIISLDEIKQVLKKINIIPAIEKGFVEYSSGNAVVPPVGELLLKNPPGDVHIKYGYINGDDYYVVKIASGFYDNPRQNLPTTDGLMLLFSQKTGELVGILMDRGHLTNLRTGAAGAIAAKYLAPKKISKIGIIGTGTQAFVQLKSLRTVIDCNEVIVFGRRENDKLSDFKIEMEKENYRIETTRSIDDVTDNCNLIVTTTSSTLPLLFAQQIKKGTHITAVGADSPHKQELDENIFGLADIIVADSILQCIERGDIAHAVRKNIIDMTKLIELGNVISGKVKGRTKEDQITVADLTGVAVQDIQIAKAVFEALE